MGLFSRLFARTPRYHESAYGWLNAAVVARLTRSGITVGKTAGYPRVEVHSFTEEERLDKEGAIRSLSFTVETMDSASLAAAVAVNEENLELLTEDLTIPEGWRCLGVLPGQMQSLTETADSAKIIYRVLQAFNVFVERDKEEESNNE